MLFTEESSLLWIATIVKTGKQLIKSLKMTLKRKQECQLRLCLVYNCFTFGKGFSKTDSPGTYLLRGTCKITNNYMVFLTLASSSGGSSSTKLLGNMPTLPFNSPSHQPSLSVISLLSMEIMSPSISFSSSAFSGSYAKVTLARSFAFLTENI